MYYPFSFQPTSLTLSCTSDRPEGFLCFLLGTYQGGFQASHKRDTSTFRTTSLGLSVTSTIT